MLEDVIKDILYQLTNWKCIPCRNQHQNQVSQFFSINQVSRFFRALEFQFPQLEFDTRKLKALLWRILKFVSAI